MYRVYIIWGGQPWALILPTLVYLASICAIFSRFSFLAADFHRQRWAL